MNRGRVTSSQNFDFWSFVTYHRFDFQSPQVPFTKIATRTDDKSFYCTVPSSNPVHKSKTSRLLARNMSPFTPNASSDYHYIMPLLLPNRDMKSNISTSALFNPSTSPKARTTIHTFILLYCILTTLLQMTPLFSYHSQAQNKGF